MYPFENAKWIFGKADNEKNLYFNFFTSFNLETAEKVLFHISACRKYALEINSVFVPASQLDDYEDNKIYDSIDVTPYCVQGENKIKIGLYCSGANTATNRIQQHGVIFSVFADGKEILVSNEDCAVQRDRRYAPIEEFITWQMGYGFDFDSTASLGEIEPATVVEKPLPNRPRAISQLIIEPVKKGVLLAQGVFKENGGKTNAEKMHKAFLAHKDEKGFVEIKDEGFAFATEDDCQGAYFLFGLEGETVGLLDFSLELDGDAEVLIGFGEHLDDLRVRSFVGGRNFCLRYKAKKGENKFFYPFARFGAKFLQIHVYAKQGKINYFGLRHTVYPVRDLPCPSSDGLHKLIWSAGVKTLKECMHEHYEDCPWREQGLYSMDSRVQMLCGYFAFGEYPFARNSLVLMAQSLTEDGFIQLCAPGITGVNIPSFTAIFIRNVLEYTLYSKDETLKDEIMPELKAIIEGFEKRVQKNNLIPQINGMWNFYEWQPNLANEPWGNNGKEHQPLREQNALFDCALNAFVSDAFRCFSLLTEDSALAEKYLTLSNNMNEAINKSFYREEFGGYATFDFQEKPENALIQALAVFCGAAKGKQAESALELIKSGALYPCSLSMTIFAYETLLDTSLDNLTFVIKDIEAIWSKMLLSGADTFWETAKGASDFAKAGSLCHGWSAVPVYIFGKYLKKE